MSDVDEEGLRYVEEVSIPLPPSKEGSLPPSSNLVKVIKRNRRGPMIRPSISNPTKYLSNRDHNDHMDLRRVNNVTNRDQESLIESLLRQPLDIRPPPKGNSTFSHKTDRYGPPFVEEEASEGYEASHPFGLNLKSLKCKNMAFSRALALLVTLSILIIVIIVLSRFTSASDISSDGKSISHGAVTSNAMYNNKTNPFGTKEDGDQTANLEQRGRLINKDTTMDIGFATDDMIVDQSQLNGLKIDGTDELNDDRSDLFNNSNDPENNVKDVNNPIIAHKSPITTIQSENLEELKENP